MDSEPTTCPEHVWAVIGITTVDGEIHRVWDCERCAAWTSQRLEEDRHVPFAESGLPN